MIGQCLDRGVDGIVMADDLSTENGPLVNPADIDDMCRDFYTRAVDAAHGAGAPLLLHCCGNLTRLVDMFRTWRLDGFAAIQCNINDLPDLYEKMGASVTIMAGIETDMLATDPPPPAAMERLGQIVATLGPTGNFVLGSSCGLYDGDFLDRVQRIYDIAAERGTC
jgi:uroporphyrinogen decarboxylase